MNDFSALPAAANDSRLSNPDGVAPNAPNPALQARRQKLRRIVTWVVGGATLLMCAGVVRAAIRSHWEPDSAAATNTAAVIAASSSVAVVAPAVPDPAATQATAVPAPTPSAVTTAAPKVAKKGAAHAKAGAKPSKHGTVAKSVRH